MTWNDTIAAVASASGGAARGIIRLSGPESMHCLARCFAEVAGELHRLSEPRVLVARWSRDGRSIPCQLYCWPTQRSYTREPSAELHLPGSPPLLQRVLAALCAAGARTAEPGEFTMRAFLAGRVDLTQAEAVLGIIDAQNSERLNVALQQMAGGISRPLHALRERLLDLLAHLEAGLDFVEEDIAFIQPAELQRSLDECAGSVRALAEQMQDRTVDSQDVRIVLRGAPNAGKSSLFNALLGRDSAIVSSQEGTTRDYLLGEWMLGQQRYLLVDTAGVEPSVDDSIQRSAQQQMHEQTRTADLELICLDGARSMSPLEQQWLATPTTMPRIVVVTKCDLEIAQRATHPSALPISSTSGEGLSRLKSQIAETLERARGEATHVVGATAARCRDILQQAAESLEHAAVIHQSGLGEELIAAELRVALDALGRVAGAVYTDDVLDRIFSRFCIGK